MKKENALDQVLEMFAEMGRERKIHSSHGTMAAEALVSMGRTDAVISWAEHYKQTDLKRNNEIYPQASGDISHQNWRDAIGDKNRRTDWVAFFEKEISKAGWKTLLGNWVSHLAPGLAAAAAHGLVRTSHAVRSLESSESSERKHELAEGLGYWASWYQTLPASIAKERGTLKPSQAIQQIKTMSREQVRRGNIVAALSSLDDFPSFNNAINLVEVSGDALRFISDLTETFAGVYLANARDFASTITLVHAVTGASAIRLLLPYAKAETRTDLLRYGWQLAAGIYAVSGRTPSYKLPESTLPDKAALIESAVKNADSHVIKLTEVCLREYALNSKPVYLHAAQHVINNLNNT